MYVHVFRCKYGVSVLIDAIGYWYLRKAALCVITQGVKAYELFGVVPALHGMQEVRGSSPLGSIDVNHAESWT